MKEIINEYGRSLIVTGMFVLFLYLLFGSSWLTGIGKTMTKKELTHETLKEIDYHTKPILTVNETTTMTLGESINLKELASAMDMDGNDISEDVLVEFIDTNFENDIFTPIVAGTYTIKYKVYDSYHYSAFAVMALEVI